MLHESDQLVLLRLNYEWKHLVNLIKNEGKDVWESVYGYIAESLEIILGDVEVQIASEYMIFDNTVRQLGDSNILLIYFNLVENYKRVFGLTCFYPMARLRKEFKITRTTDLANRHFSEFNRILQSQGWGDLGDEMEVYFHSFEFNVENFNLIEDMEEMYPEQENIFEEFRRYAEAIYLFELVCPVPEIDFDEESESEEPETPENSEGNVSEKDLLRVMKMLLSKV